MSQLPQSYDRHEKTMSLEEDALSIVFTSAYSCFRVVMDDANLPSRIKSAFQNTQALFHHLQDELNYLFDPVRAVLLVRVKGEKGHKGRCLTIYLNPMTKRAKEEEVQKLIGQMVREQQSFRLKLVEKVAEIE